ncbi:MAG: SufD family Fe-S cluster assembly protein [Patescibacteria group bacterium]
MQSNCSKKCAAGSPCGDCSLCSAAVDVAKEAALVIAPGERRAAPVLLPVAEKVSVDIGAGAEVSLLESAVGPACAGVEQTELTITLAEGASVRLVSMRECAAHGQRAYHSRFTLDKSAKLKVIECRLGGGNISSSAVVDLAGEEASVEFMSALFAAETDQLLSDININHFASRSTSRIITKCVLADAARIKYRGLVHIARDTCGCVGEQRADALLVSSRARADLMPDLKIDANDVRCSHGSTISGLDEHKLYYLMSRGLSRSSAMNAAARGFMATVLGGLDESEAEAVERILAPRLKCALTTLDEVA